MICRRSKNSEVTVACVEEEMGCSELEWDCQGEEWQRRVLADIRGRWDQEPS